MSEELELVTEDEKKLSYYREYLLKLKREQSNEIFTNKGEAHASILMGTLLESTRKSLSMYCVGLRPGILCGRLEEQGNENGYQGFYWKVFKHFFTETIKEERFKEESIKILIQDDKYLQYQPFKIVKNAYDCPETKRKIVVKKITESCESRIKKILGGDESTDKFNFSVFDDDKFRLEYDPDNYMAIGSFNDKSWNKILKQLFDEAFDSAVPVGGFN